MAHHRTSTRRRSTKSHVSKRRRSTAKKSAPKKGKTLHFYSVWTGSKVTLPVDHYRETKNDRVQAVACDKEGHKLFQFVKQTPSMVIRKRSSPRAKCSRKR